MVFNMVCAADQILILKRKPTTNGFCATGKGGGIDNTCGVGSGSSSAPKGFIKLPKGHDNYFTKTVSKDAKYKVVKMADLEPIRARPEGIINANKYMKQAQEGTGGKREPISVVKVGSKYKIMDGNSTYANAHHSKWNTLPVQLFKTEAAAQSYEAGKKAAKKKPTANNCGIAKGGFQPGNSCAKGSKGLGSVKFEITNPKFVSRGGDKSTFETKTLFSKKEIESSKVKVAQPCAPNCGQDTLYTLAKTEFMLFDHSLNHGEGVDKAIGGKVIRPDSVDEFLGSLELPGSLIIIAPLKGEKRAAEKVNGKYGGDWSKLTDVIRATVAVDSKSELPNALEKTREEMAEKGFELVNADNRIATPLPSGYRDMNTLWRGPNGVIVELQFNTKEMIKAKETEGHPIYEKERVILEKAASEGRSLTIEEDREVKALDKKMRRIYDAAWARK